MIHIQKLRTRTWAARLLALITFVPGIIVPAAAQAQTARMTLETAIFRSLAANGRLQQAEAQRVAAHAAAGPLTSEYMPRASFTTSSTYSQYPLTVTPIREQGVFPPLDDQIHEVALNLSWTVFDFGRGSAGRRSAQALAEAAGVQYDLAKMETIERIASDYVRLSQLQSVRVAQHDRVEALNKRRAEIEALHEEGRVSNVELLRMAEVILTAETDVRKTDNDLSAVLLDLSSELGSSDVLTLEDVALFPLDDVHGWPAELPSGADLGPAEIAMEGESSPRVMLARKSLEAARYSAREADRSSLPAFELFASERLRSGSSFSFDDELYGGIRVNVPLFQPRQRAQRQVERARVTEREAALRTALLDYDVAARDLANREREALERAAAYKARVEYLEETYRIESAAHEEGRLTLSDLLDTEARLAATRSEVAAAKAHAFTIRLNRSVLAGTLTPTRALHLIGIEG